MSSLPFIILHLLGLACGIFSVAVVAMTRRKMGGQVSQAFLYVMFGAISETSALVFSVFFDKVSFLPLYFYRLHDIMMAVGLMFFAIAAKKFAGLSR